jgi:protein-L-isoaspartate(D-aspartate) O-methyltransferase
MILRRGKGKDDGEEGFASRRKRMVETQIVRRGVRDPLVLSAMRSVPRHEFVPEEERAHAYEDRPLPIGEEQTISQPYIVALMTELLELRGVERVLEIGTGSGYQAAVLAEIVQEVYTIEILEPLMRQARAHFERLFYKSIHVRHDDGWTGWPEAAPFDGIIVTAAPVRIPEPLVEQLVDGGKMVVPTGRHHQDLMVVTRGGEAGEIRERRVIPVRFVPMTGRAEIDIEKGTRNER